MGAKKVDRIVGLESLTSAQRQFIRDHGASHKDAEAVQSLTRAFKGEFSVTHLDWGVMRTILRQDQRRRRGTNPADAGPPDNQHTKRQMQFLNYPRYPTGS